LDARFREHLHNLWAHPHLSKPLMRIAPPWPRRRSLTDIHRQLVKLETSLSFAPPAPLAAVSTPPTPLFFSRRGGEIVLPSLGQDPGSADSTQREPEHRVGPAELLPGGAHPQKALRQREETDTG